jgi:hypothetical protein
MVRVLSSLLLAGALAAASMASAAGHWSKVMKVDPFEGKDGSAHFYSKADTFQDGRTDWIVTHLSFTSPAQAQSGEVGTWYLWAFDCHANAVRYIGADEGKGFKVNSDWRAKPSSLAQDDMDGVTKELGRQLCALDGLWPKGEIAY